MKDFKERLKEHQICLINESTIFDGAKGGGEFRNVKYEHILAEGEKNIYRGVREDAIEYFKNNEISFWNGDKPTGDTLSSQISCLNHLFAIREDEEAVKAVMQSFVGQKLSIDRMKIVQSDDFNSQYISFEAICPEDYMNEVMRTRGKYCTSIDAIAIAVDKSGKEILLVIEWKLVENDSGNKAPSKNDASEYNRGLERIRRYSKLLNESKLIDSYYENTDRYQDSVLFRLPFYELMRQTIWAEQVCKNPEYLGPKDYLHIVVLPEQNIMRHKNYQYDKKGNKVYGIPEVWPSLLSDKAKARFIVANPKSVIESLGGFKKYKDLVDYLTNRYYRVE